MKKLGKDRQQMRKKTRTFEPQGTNINPQPTSCMLPVWIIRTMSELIASHGVLARKSFDMQPNKTRGQILLQPPLFYSLFIHYTQLSSPQTPLLLLSLEANTSLCNRRAFKTVLFFSEANQGGSESVPDRKLL